MKRLRPFFVGLTFTWQRLPPRSRIDLGVALLVMTLAAFLNALIPVFLGGLAAEAQGAVESGKAWGISEAQSALYALAACFLTRELLGLVRKVLIHKVCTCAERDMTVAVMGHLLRLDIHDVRRTNSGELQGQIRANVDGFVKLIRVGLIDFMPALLTAAFAVGVAYSRSEALGLVILMAIISLLLVVFRQAASQQGKRGEIMDRKAAMGGMIAERIGGLDQIRVMDTHAHEETKIARAADKLREVEMTHHSAMAGFDFFKATVESIFFVMVTALSIYQASSGVIPLGEIITATVLFGSVLAPVREIHRIIDEGTESAIAVGKLRGLLERPLDKAFCAGSKNGGYTDAPAVVARMLTLGYAGDPAVVSKLNLQIAEGEFVGIVGATGSGKSTLLKAIQRLVHPTGGEMNLFGRSIDTMSPTDISAIVGVVSQNPFLFSGTLRENLIYGGMVPTEGELAAALRASALVYDLDALGGLERTIGERGENISGGQRQRVALARVFLNPKRLLLFDEATSALDNSNEAVVLSAIHAFKRKATIVMVAHRLSTLRSADRIMVMDAGRIVEQGTFAELADAGGAFARLLHDGQRKPDMAVQADSRR